MERSFWDARWSEGQIGFHQGRPNAHLETHLARLGAPGVVFVPLCGKAEDLAYLAAKGHRVIGVEWVDDAVRAFFSEHGLTPTQSAHGKLKRYESGSITIFSGDFFAIRAEHVEGMTAVWDRAALIALPPDVRVKYVAHLRSLVKPKTPGLLITVEYDQSKMGGPPFSVEEKEVRAGYAPNIELLSTEKADGPRFVELVANEKCFSVTF
ncbi:MAG: thiopurine S-methyltransferase [Archangium sp.]|nr:thiopurine S-methyltransferase [Archangium sp.]